MVGDPPLAYFISFRCYGTWLHGDERGSTDWLHNQYGSPFPPHDEDWQRQDQRLLRQPPLALSADQRTVVERAIQSTCTIREWELLAVNVRTNHVHVVVSCNGTRPELVLNALKSNATRTLRQRGYWKNPYSPWSDHGSKRYLWSEQGIQQAIDYVNELAGLRGHTITCVGWSVELIAVPWSSARGVDNTTCAGGSEF